MKWEQSLVDLLLLLWLGPSYDLRFASALILPDPVYSNRRCCVVNLPGQSNNIIILIRSLCHLILVTHTDYAEKLFSNFSHNLKPKDNSRSSLDEVLPHWPLYVKPIVYCSYAPCGDWIGDPWRNNTWGVPVWLQGVFEIAVGRILYPSIGSFLDLDNIWKDPTLRNVQWCKASHRTWMRESFSFESIVFSELNA